jgi:hypothetical protein
LPGPDFGNCELRAWRAHEAARVLEQATNSAASWRNRSALPEAYGSARPDGQMNAAVNERLAVTQATVLSRQAPRRAGGPSSHCCLVDRPFCAMSIE